MPKKENTTTPVKTVMAKPRSAASTEVLRTSPKDVFLHLLMLVMLYIGVISLIALSFAYVDYSFPDALNYYRSGLLDNIRFQSAMLVVSFPLLLILAYFVQRDFRQNPKKHELRFYKWLTYFTLFVSAITIVVDLIQLVNRFYSGELTTAFVLKVVAVLVITGAVFGYYIWDVQAESYKSTVPAKVGWASSALVLGMLVLGFVLVGSPAHQRQIRMDEQRVSDLSSLQSQIIYYWQRKQELPKELAKLVDDLSYSQLPVDPETKAAYEYKVLGDTRFELCAVFNLENQHSPEGGFEPAYVYDVKMSSSDWRHAAGRQCFERTIDPELYPPFEK